PNRGSVIIDTLSDGDVLGWSWLFHPFQWHFNARALEPTNAVEFDARALRDKKSEDIYFGYTLLQRTARLLESRLEATREHLVEVLASPDYQQQV
ncbi:MAG: hypothetical protein GWN00_19355, partial [Aliifodinibius sp.]|nr:hypothetical protein [Fodinibius sp.]NIV13223.1 hypothetical protein [Fodinibius sp.]NIY26884.1 hypothetical protein [Fodinibius sp.]